MSQLFNQNTSGGHAYLSLYDQKYKDWIYELFPILKKRRKQLAGTLSGGEQQMLTIGRGQPQRHRSTEKKRT